MANTIYLNGNEPLIASITRAAFPAYTGKLFKLRTAETVNCASSWDGGSRTYFRFVSLADMRTSAEVPAQSAFDKPIAGISDVTLPDGIACVQHAIFCGKDMGITIVVNPATLNPAMLPAVVELSDDDRIVLAYTAHLKSSYNGQSRHDRARSDTGITIDRWNAAKAGLIGRKLLTKIGAITPDGRNAIGNWKPAGCYSF